MSLRLISVIGGAVAGRVVMGLALGFVSVAGISTAAPVSKVAAQKEAAEVKTRLKDLETLIKGFKVVSLGGASGRVELKAEQGYTVEDLRGVALGPAPHVRKSSVAYEAHHLDGMGDEAPYVAKRINPFRLEYFTCEFNVGGWYNFNMYEYVTTHGFNVIYPYVMPDRDVFPKGTQLLKWGTYVDWPQFFAAHRIPEGRFDLLAELNVAGELEGAAWPVEPNTIVMLDLEHAPCVSPDELRAQPWYPKGHSKAAREAFEHKYYQGYLLTHTGPIQALRNKGWKHIGVYPQGYGTSYFPMMHAYERNPETDGMPDPGQNWAWQRWGKDFIETQEVLYPDQYMFYWTPQNLAYAMGRTDYDRALVKTLPVAEQRPIRPYYWMLLHGGDPKPHWWARQPLANETARALACMTLFTGADGWVVWGWNDVDSDHVPGKLWLEAAETALESVKMDGGIGNNLMVKDDFEVRPRGKPDTVKPTLIRRYDVLPVVSVDGRKGLVQFQHIDTKAGQGDQRLIDGKPVYEMKTDELLKHIRPRTEPVAGLVEGLALAKPVEYFLYHGEPQVDVPAIQQFMKNLPVVRRVKCGDVSIIATHDPWAVQGGETRPILLHDFDGKKGLTLKLPADAETRIFVVRR